MNELKRVHYVTGNYGNLQGLRWVAWGVLCLAVAAEDGGWLDSAVLLILIPIALLLFFGTTWYYRFLYGEVNAGINKGKDWPFGVALTGAGILSLFVDRGLNPPIYIAPLLFAAVMAWLGWQGRPFRWHYFLVAIITLGADLLLLLPGLGQLLGAIQPGVFLWILIGVSLMIVGVFDHLLLTRTFRPINEEIV